MIRFVSIASLAALLALVLYLPSAYPPERFVRQMRIEHGLNVAFWGGRHAMRIMARMLDLQTAAKQAGPAPGISNPPASAAAGAVAMAQVSRRLFNNPYFKSVDALFALAAYRWCALLEWLPVLAVVMAALLVDGLLLRMVKSKEFKRHDPELFALHGCAAAMTVCGTVIVFVLPVTLHPVVLALVPVAIGVLTSGAVRNFHRRG